MTKYSREHEWVRLEGDVATIGITTYAAEELGDITFVELPDTGTSVAKGDSLCVVESVKAASDVFAPVGATVREVNEPLEDNPEMLNQSPEKEAWLCRLDSVDAADMEALMTEEEYRAFTTE